MFAPRVRVACIKGISSARQLTRNSVMHKQPCRNLSQSGTLARVTARIINDIASRFSYVLDSHGERVAPVLPSRVISREGRETRV
jgi:hypothetical protein